MKLLIINFDPAGYGSIRETLKDAVKYDKNITYDDVKKWKDTNIENKRQLKGSNSFIASKAYQEFQIDIMFFSDLKESYNGGLLLVDIFSKYTQVVPIHGKTTEEILDALIEGIKLMKGKPEVIYSDNEPSFSSTKMKEYLRDNNIKHIITLNHAPVAERQIRTIKDMIYKRVENTGKPWIDLLYQVLLTYNNKMIHSITKMTPDEARKSTNELNVKTNLELKRRNTRIYPNIEVGDSVKTYKKKTVMTKERVSRWSDEIHIVEYITESHGQKFYKLSDRDRLCLRNEILLLD